MASKIKRKEKGIAKISGQTREIHIERQISYQPLPTPEELQKYEAIHPGIADRILSQIEKQQEAHKEIALQAIVRDKMEIKNEELGIRASKSIALMMLLFSFILVGVGVYMDSKWIIFGAVGVTFFISIIVIALTTLRSSDNGA